MLRKKLVDTAAFHLAHWRIAARPPAGAGSRAGTRPHILLLSWAFPPSESSSGHFPKAIAESAVQMAMDITVVCAPLPPVSHPQGIEMLSALPANLRIVRTNGTVSTKNDLVDRPILRSIPVLDGGFDTAVAIASTAIEACRNHPPTLILAAGPRFANFVAGYYVARQTNANLAFLYMDEWCVRTPPFVGATDTDRKWERRCLEAAASVCYVTEGKRSAYEDAYPFLKSKPALVCPNGWDEAAFAKAHFDTDHLRDYKRYFTISFVGRAAPSAPIHPFLDALDATLAKRPDLAEKIRVLLVGNQPEDVQSRIAEFSRRHSDAAKILPAVPQSNAIEIMRESSALLLLCTTQYPGIVPQKTYDYLNVPTPILAYGGESDAATIVEAAQAGVVVRDRDPAALEDALESLMSSPRENWNNPVRQATAARYNRHAITKDLLQRLLQLPTNSGDLLQ